MPRLRHRAAASGVALCAAAALLLAACSPSDTPSTPGPSGAKVGPASCTIKGAPEGTTQYCLDIKNATSPAKGQLTEKYRVSTTAPDGKESYQVWSNTLAQDGSMLAVSLPITDTDAEPAPGHPPVGLLGKDGFTAYSYDIKGTMAYDVVGTVRSGDTVAWAEYAEDADSLKSDWAIYSATGTSAKQIGTPALTKEQPKLSLDTSDPGPALTKDQVLWRMTDQDALGDDTVADVPQFLASAPAAGGKVTLTKDDLGLYNRDADGSHIVIDTAEGESAYTVKRQTADGKQETLFTGTLNAGEQVGGLAVLDGNIIWWSQAADVGDSADDGTGTVDDGTGDDGAGDDGAIDGGLDEGTIDEGAIDTPATQGAPAPGTPGTPGGTGKPVAAGKGAAIGQQVASTSPAATGEPSAEPTQAAVPPVTLYIYTPGAKRLVSLVTNDQGLTSDYLTASGERLTLASDDANEYLIDLKSATITTIGTCPDGCSDAGVAGSTVYHAELDKDSNQQVVISEVK